MQRYKIPFAPSSTFVLFLMYRTILYGYLTPHSFHVTLYEFFTIVLSYSLRTRIDFVFHESLFGGRRIIY